MTRIAYILTALTTLFGAACLGSNAINCDKNHSDDIANLNRGLSKEYAVCLNYSDTCIKTFTDTLGILNKKVFSLKSGLDAIEYWFSEKGYYVSSSGYDVPDDLNSILVKYPVNRNRDTPFIDLRYTLSDGVIWLTDGFITIPQNDVMTVQIGDSSQSILKALGLTNFKSEDLKSIGIEQCNELPELKVENEVYGLDASLVFNNDTLVSIEIGSFESAQNVYGL